MSVHPSRHRMTVVLHVLLVTAVAWVAFKEGADAIVVATSDDEFAFAGLVHLPTAALILASAIAIAWLLLRWHRSGRRTGLFAADVVVVCLATWLTAPEAMYDPAALLRLPSALAVLTLAILAGASLAASRIEGDGTTGGGGDE